MRHCVVIHKDKEQSATGVPEHSEIRLDIARSALERQRLRLSRSYI